MLHPHRRYSVGPHRFAGFFSIATQTLSLDPLVNLIRTRRAPLNAELPNIPKPPAECVPPLLFRDTPPFRVTPMLGLRVLHLAAAPLDPTALSAYLPSLR